MPTNKLDLLIHVSDTRFEGGAVADGSANATPAIQAALDFAGTVAPATVVADDGDQAYLVDEVTVPTGVEFRFDLKMLTAATVGIERNCIRPMSGCKLVGQIEGSNTTNVEVVERGIFPAADGVSDVVLDVSLTKMTVGVQATSNDLNNPPRRWSGTIRCTDIAGLVPSPNGNGYGLNATMCDSNITLFCKNVPRHSLYLSAGASNNNIEIHDDGSRFAPIDIAALDGQPECYGNVVRAFVRGHKADYTGLNHYGGFISGNCRGNVVEMHVSDSEPLTAAFYMQANSPTAVPRDNQVTVYFDGQIKGPAVAHISSSTGTRIKVFGSGNGTNATLRAIVYVDSNIADPPTSPRPVTCTIEQIDFVSSGNVNHAVVMVANYGITDLGKGTIKATGLSGAQVNFWEFSKRVVGWIFETNFVGQTGSIAANATGKLKVPFDDPLPTRRYISYSVSPLADPGALAPAHYIHPLLDHCCEVKVKNNDTVPQDFVVSGRAWGF